MSVYSSDPFVWEKEQAGRAGPEAAWFLEPDLQESVCGSIHCRVCLSVSKGEYVNTQQAQPPAPLGCPSCLSEEARARRGGYKRAPVLECTAQASHRKPTGRICNYSFLCWESAALRTDTRSSSQGNVSVVLGSGGKLSSTTHLREGY